MQKILITGSNGLLGQKLQQLLITSPYNTTVEVLATSRGNNRCSITSANLRYQSMDITNREEIIATLTEFKPDAVIHTAAMTQVDDCETQRDLCWQLNVNSVEYLIEACQQLKQAGQAPFLVHLSTDFIFDGAAGPYHEEATANPVSYYGESKLAAEQALLASNIQWSIARTVLVYGITEAMSRSNIILWVKKSLEEGKTIHVVDDQWRTPTLAEDLAMGCFLMADKKISGIFNISGKDFLTPYEMAIKTAKYFNLDASLIVKTDASRFSQPAKRPPKTGFILDKAIQQLNYAPRSFDEGIAILDQQLKATV
ncbi:SDR family oxidoreductase [uncultured Microscilla sp.]|uniref:SDR family oxidoreductase n=1 Tax=uncultured Microscilla sp. TaxID=432653 RepID=UPI0026103C82|nr:SDR family oxidoreductase [uncultured Microscilla sp.]